VNLNANCLNKVPDNPGPAAISGTIGKISTLGLDAIIARTKGAQSETAGSTGRPCFLERFADRIGQVTDYKLEN
jgi:hypothetical protein